MLAATRPLMNIVDFDMYGCQLLTPAKIGRIIGLANPLGGYLTLIG